LISFGTDGWRSVMGQGFTFANVQRLAAALAVVLRDRGDTAAGVVVGYDRRFMSGDFAQSAAATLAAAGVGVWLATEPCPTPAIALAARKLGAARALIVTASHNSYQYNGIKLRGSDGAPLDLDAQSELEAAIAESSEPPVPARGPTPRASTGFGRIRTYDPWPAYRRQIEELIDLKAIRGSRLALAHDAMHGSAAGWLHRLLPSTRALRCRPDPTFGGGAPEPIEDNLGALRDSVKRSRRPLVGLATDGDGDRLAAFAEDGQYVSPHHLLAMLYIHLVEVRGLRGTVVRTVTTSTIVDRIAAGYGWAVEVTPVGFRHVAACLKGSEDPPVLLGGEESGGIGVAMHLPERDGVFAALLLLEHLALRGISLAECLRDLDERVGHLCVGRQDIRVPAPSDPEWDVPLALLGEPVTAWRRFDGLHLHLADGAWLHLRASGTEPVLRVYAEAKDPGRLEALLGAGRALVTGNAGSRA